jgi:hypothetical protein
MRLRRTIGVLPMTSKMDCQARWFDSQDRLSIMRLISSL